VEPGGSSHPHRTEEASMASRVSEGFGLLKEAFRDFSEDECPTRAAALSYYTVFALPPLLMLILLVVSVFLDADQVQRLLTGQFRGLMGEEGARAVDAMLRNVDRPDARKGLASILSVAGLLFGATGAFLQLQSALNRAWEVKPDPEQGGIRAMLLKRILSLGMILCVAFLLLVSLALSAAISAMGETLGNLLPGIGPVLQTVIDLSLSLMVITVLFSAIFRVLPDARIAWRDVWPGALVTAALFVIGKFAIGFYLGRSNPGEAFGAAGSLAIVLVWIYYSSMIVLFGAEFTEKWAVRFGSGIVPEKGAIRIAEDASAAGPKPAPRAAEERPVVLVADRPTPALDRARSAPRRERGPSTLAVLTAAVIDRFVRRRA
jgi:membrane protein